MRYACTDEMIAIRLTEGEDLHESIAKVCEERGIDAAVVVSAVGMVHKIRFGWFTGNGYDVKEVDGVFELVALSGDVSIKNGDIYPHLHAVFSSPDHSTLGGHILQAVVNNNVELFLKPLRTIRLPREFDGWFDAISPTICE